jgi:hypothetical protein
VAGIYSTLLIAASITSSAAAEYEVPAGYLVVVRDIEVVSLSSGSFVFACYTSPFNAYICVIPSFTANESQQWRGRSVVPNGTIVCGAESGTLFVRVSGYLLGPS